MKSNPRLARFSWALYDLANTIFSMNIISFYFVLWLTVDRACPEIYYSFALAASIFLAALLMPILGEIQDRLKIRLPFLISFTLACVLFTATLGLVRSVGLVLFFFALANLFYQLSGIVYASLLSQVSQFQNLGRTSGLGVSLGYVGTILGLILAKPFLSAGGRQATFVPTAFLFLIFALPSFIFIKDSPRPYIPKIELDLKRIFSKLFKGISLIRQNLPLSRFLISAFLCLNAINAIVVYMGVYANRVIGFGDSELIYFMIASTVFAIFGSYGFGCLVDRWGSRNTLKLVIKLWCLAIFLAAISCARWMFWIVGPLAGICLGGTWVSARTMLIELIARDEVGRMFGLFGFLHMLSFILGTAIWGIITSWIFKGPGTFKYRLALGSLFAFMFAGYRILRQVEDPRRET